MTDSVVADFLPAGGRVLDHLGGHIPYLLENVPGFVAILEGSEHHFAYANQAYSELVGRRPLMGRNIREALPELRGQGFIQRLDEVFRTASPFTATCAEAMVQDEQGELRRRRLDFAYKPILDSGEVVGILVSGVEIPARPEEQEQLLRDTLDDLPQMVWVHGQQGGVYYNRQWRTFTGEDRANRPDFDRTSLIHAEDRPATLEAWRRAQETGEYEREFRLLHHSGEYRWLLSRGNPARDEHGVILGWFGTCTEIHGRVENERRLRRLQEEVAQAAQRGAMEFVADTLAHEINQPLTAAQLYLSGVKRLAGAESQVSAGLDQAQRQIARIGEIVGQARAAVAGRAAKTRIALQDLVDEATLLVHANETARDVLIETRFDEAAQFVEANRVQLEQVFTNLLRNACHAMRLMPGEKRVEIRSRPDAERMIEIEVRDTGPGVKNLLQGATPQGAGAGSPAGMGLGLPIARIIIEGHGGKLWWQNNEGGGASFFLTLPAGAPESSP